MSVRIDTVDRRFRRQSSCSPDHIRVTSESVVLVESKMLTLRKAQSVQLRKRREEVETKLS